MSMNGKLDRYSPESVRAGALIAAHKMASACGLKESVMAKKTAARNVELSVGDKILTGAQADRLPLGTVLVERMNDDSNTTWTWVKGPNGWLQPVTMVSGSLSRGLNGMEVTVDAAHVPMKIAFIPKGGKKPLARKSDAEDSRTVESTHVPLAPCPFCGGVAQEILTTVGDGKSVVEQRMVGCWAQWCPVQPKVCLQPPLSARYAWNHRRKT